MKLMSQTSHTPTTAGSLGHAARGASELTRPLVGGQGAADIPSLDERDEQRRPYTLHDALAEYGIPVPLHAIYRANTIARDELDALLPATQKSTHPPAEVSAPALIERAASDPGFKLSDPCRRWAASASEGEPCWAWVRAVPVEHAMAAALLMARETGRDGMVGRLDDLASSCRQAPLYGADSRDAVIGEWARIDILGIAVTSRDRLDAMALEALLKMLRQRCDALLPTVFCSDASGANIFHGKGRARAEAALCRDIASVIAFGLSGFQADAKDKPLVIEINTNMKEEK